MDNAAISFCKWIGRAGAILKPLLFRQKTFPFPYNGGFGKVEIAISLKIKESCEWPYDFDQCRKYLGVPVDSCNCGGINNKQGGRVENNCYDWKIDPNRYF
jgi:hypothetical protein